MTEFNNLQLSINCTCVRNNRNFHQNIETHNPVTSWKSPQISANVLATSLSRRIFIAIGRNSLT
ncbi:hypothetical protein STP4a_191 [Salmonella phage STP4-a]|uniref:Uncharacterized protein n=1 Tax=Salmonella phage STP4-a TaxID=1445860 RepID=A0A0B4L9X2_9CAUD|nr:hypothetical protein STP4a_191 [Salmonella phage STP4-a]AHJ86788.1 hypothetical protein STP4a_191 [Salmonella phage STP4-a]